MEAGFHHLLHRVLSAVNVWTVHSFSQEPFIDYHPHFTRAKILAKITACKQPGPAVSKTRCLPLCSAAFCTGPAKRVRGISLWQPLTQLASHKTEQRETAELC